MAAEGAPSAVSLGTMPSQDLIDPTASKLVNVDAADGETGSSPSTMHSKRNVSLISG